MLLVFQEERWYDSVHGWVERAMGEGVQFSLTRNDDGAPSESQTRPGGGADGAPPGDDAVQEPEAEPTQTFQPEETEGTAGSRPSAGQAYARVRCHGATLGRRDRARGC